MSKIDDFFKDGGEFDRLNGERIEIRGKKQYFLDGDFPTEDAKREIAKFCIELLEDCICIDVESNETIEQQILNNHRFAINQLRKWADHE